MNKKYLPFSSNLNPGQTCLFKVTSEIIEEVSFENETFIKENLVGIAYSIDLENVYFSERLVVNEATRQLLKAENTGLVILAECQEKLSKNENFYKQLVPLRVQDLDLIKEKISLLESKNALLSYHGCNRVDRFKGDVDEDDACCGGFVYWYDESDEYGYSFDPFPRDVLNLKIQVTGVDALESGKRRFYLDNRSTKIIQTYDDKIGLNSQGTPDGFDTSEPKWCSECYYFLEYFSSGFKVGFSTSNESIHPDSIKFIAERAFENAWVTVSYLDFTNKSLIHHSYVCLNLHEVIQAIDNIKIKVGDIYSINKLSISKVRGMLIEQ